MKTYQSRKSILLGTILWSLLLAPLLKAIFSIGSFVFIACQALVVLFVAIIWFGLRYGINDESLLIWIGPFKSTIIPVKEINSVERSYNPLSSPAASLRRMLVKYQGGEVLISPKNEKGFVSDLKKINQSISCGISWEKENESIFKRFVKAIL